MKRSLFALPLVAALALGACTTTQEQNSALIGAAGGAVLGAAISDKDDRLTGAVLGAAAGAVAGTMLGRAQNNQGQCWYADGRGGRYMAAC